MLPPRRIAVRLSRRRRKGLGAGKKGLEAGGKGLEAAGRWVVRRAECVLGWAWVGWGGEDGGGCWGGLRWAVVEAGRRKGEADGRGVGGTAKAAGAERGREAEREAERGSWRQRENSEAERGRWSARVATHVVGDEHAVEPHGGVAEGALEVEPEHVALPLRGDGELLPVPKHVAGEVRLARAAIGAGALRGRARDQAVVWQADLRPVVVSVLRHGLVRSGTGVRVGWRLCVPVGLRVQASAVSPPKVEA